MIDAMRSEWLKLRSVTSTIVLLCFVAGVSIGFGLLATATIQLDDASLDIDVADRISFALAGVSTSLTLLAVVGVLLMTQEFRFNTIRVTFAAVPSRPRVILAKALVIAVTALVVSAVMVAVTTALGAAVLSARDAPIDFGLAGTDAGAVRCGAALGALRDGRPGRGRHRPQPAAGPRARDRVAAAGRGDLRRDLPQRGQVPPLRRGQRHAGRRRGPGLLLALVRARPTWPPSPWSCSWSASCW